MCLKVGPCPDNEILSKFCFVLFLYSTGIILCSESVAAQKTARFCLDFAFFFSFACFLCVEIPIPKIVLSHGHKWVISDISLLS